jgi:hypothetical protein
MAYTSKRILLFGAFGIILASFLILVFIPIQKDTGMNPFVALQEIPGYGFQLVKMSEEQNDLVQLDVTLDGFEVRRADGNWAPIEIYGGEISFNMLGVRELSFAADAGDLDAGSYNAIRFNVVRELEFTNATLDQGEIIVVDVPSLKVEFTTTPFDVATETENLLLELRTGSGLLSNYMLPQLHLSLGTMKFEVAVTTT